MAALNGVAAAAWLVSAQVLAEPPIGRWEPYVSEAAIRFGVPKNWIGRVILAESDGQEVINKKPVTSRAGAMGLMQLMPGTWAEMTRMHKLGSDPYEPRSNILAGTAYLKAMYDEFGYPGLFGAYNAGPQRYASYLAGSRSLPAETIGYLRKTIMPAKGLAPGSPSSLSVARTATTKRAVAAHDRLFALVRVGPAKTSQQADQLFVIRR